MYTGKRIKRERRKKQTGETRNADAKRLFYEGKEDADDSELHVLVLRQSCHHDPTRRALLVGLWKRERGREKGKF